MMGLSCPISPASLWPPGLKFKDGDNRVSHFPSRGWWQALRLSFPLGHCERMFWDETKWLAGLFQVSHQMADDSPIVRCVHHQDWEACEQWHVRRSTASKSRDSHLRLQRQIHDTDCLGREGVPSPVFLNIELCFTELRMLMLPVKFTHRHVWDHAEFCQQYLLHEY